MFVSANKHQSRIWKISSRRTSSYVGGGAAGCVLMNKLSENGRFSVLGLEAGPNLTNAILKSSSWSFRSFCYLPRRLTDSFWWGWRQTIPQPMLNGRVGGDWVTGMMLGGGSSVNGSILWSRIKCALFAVGKQLRASSNWSLDKILQTFTAIENYQGLTITPGATRYKKVRSTFCKRQQ